MSKKASAFPHGSPNHNMTKYIKTIWHSLDIIGVVGTVRIDVILHGVDLPSLHDLMMNRKSGDKGSQHFCFNK